MKTFTVTAQAFIGDNQTRNEARELALLEAKRQALELAGVYIESLTVVKQAKVEKDEILALTGGVTQSKILKEKPIVSENSFGIEVTAQVSIDTLSIEAAIKKMLKQRETLEQEKLLLKRNQELEKQLKAYQAQIQKLKDRQRIVDLQKGEGQRIKNRLSASEWMEKGDLAYAQKNFSEALLAYDQALALDPAFVALWNKRGNAYFGLNRLAEAEQNYSEALRLAPNFAAAYYNRGNVYLRRQAYPAALVEYSQAIRLEPRFFEAWHNQGIAYFNLGKYEEALRSHTRTLALNPSHAGAYLSIGNIQFKRAQYLAAVDSFSKALALEPVDTLAYNNRALAYQGAGKIELAFLDFERAILSDPQHYFAYVNRGNLYKKLQRYAQARQDFQKACELGYQPSCKELKTLPVK